MRPRPGSCSTPSPGTGWFIESDLSAPDEPQRVVEQAAYLLDGQLDGLFYNAGYLVARPLADGTVTDWERTEAINLRAPFFMVQAAAPLLCQAPSGRIVVTSSTGALRGHARCHS